MERREFIHKGALASLGTLAFSPKSYSKILGANDRVRVACVGFSDRHRASHVPPFKALAKGMNFEMVALSDLWNRRRDEGKAYLEKELGGSIKTYRNNEELYAAGGIDAVFISTADFQHALHTIEAVKAGCDYIYGEAFGRNHGR
jgi:predicted dehydrogenase